METQESIGAWQAATFSPSEQSIALHLLSEAVELCIAVDCTQSQVMDTAVTTWEKRKIYADPQEEAADVVILAKAFAAFSGFDLGQMVNNKMKINRARKWGQPNANGFTEHVPE